MPVRSSTHRRPTLEALEDRVMPFGSGPIVWINTGDGDWGNGENWSNGVGPGAFDDAIIGAGVVVTHVTKFDAVRSLDCNGGLVIAGGSLVLSEASTVADLTVDGGTLRATEGLVVTNSFDWSNGTLGGSTIELFGVATIRAGEDKTLDGVRLDNRAELVWSGGAISSDLGIFANKTDGAVRVTGGTSLGAPFFNAGSLFITTPETVSFAAIVTTGEVVIESGGLNALSYVQMGGQTQNQGSTLEVATYRLLSGSFTGYGIVIGDVENRSIFAPSGGTLTIAGDYDQAAGGTLVLEVGNPQLESQPPLTVEGMADLAGALVADLAPGVQPTDGAVYAGLTAADRTGTFGVVSAWSDGVLQLIVAYLDDGVDLVVVANPPPTADPPGPTPTGPAGPVTPGTPGPGPTPRPILPRQPTTTTTTDDSSDDPTIVNNGGLAAAQGGRFGQAGVEGGGEGGPRSGPGGQPSPGEGGPGRMQGPTDRAAAQVGGGGRAPDGLPLPQNQTADGGQQQPTRPTPGADRSVAGKRMTLGWESEPSGLADELFSAFPLALPEMELPSERELLSTADVAAALLVGGRARANLVRGGSQVSGVATVLVSEDGGSGGRDVSPFAGLYVSPLAGLAEQLPGPEAISRAFVAPDEEGEPAEEAGRVRPGRVAALAGAVGAGVVLAALKDGDRRRRRGERA